MRARLSWLLYGSVVVFVIAKTYVDEDAVQTDYDYSILDPNTVYGSPYGGFSRNVLQKLSQLPLLLSDYEQLDGEEYAPEYMQVRDAAGKLYSCRTYLEDDLEPSSLQESMFERPRPRDKLSDKKNQDNGDSSNEDKGVEVIDMVNQEEIAEAINPMNHINALFMVENVLSKLRGVCAQIHKGWWSFEWCYEKRVSQFHIDFDVDTSTFEIQHVTNLGDYKTRSVSTALQHRPANLYATGKLELARVEDLFTKGGDLCPDTQEPRETIVNIVCCSEKWMEVGKLRVHRNRVPSGPDALAALVDVTEDPVCRYNVTICTPLLCRGNASPPRPRQKPPGKESVTEILHRAIGDSCVQTPTGTWWSYEICHGVSIYQFHEANVQRKGGDYARIRQEQHVLGKYPADYAVAPSDEYTHVTNASSVEKGGGNHAYYEIEYTGGDVCDAPEVQDHVADVLERSTSVRYYCGQDLSIMVREDRTCHYVFEVFVPELCEHPLFRPPVAQREVVKCVPAQDDSLNHI